MKIINGVKKVAKPFIDVPTWIGYKQIAEGARGIANSVKSLFIPQKADKAESFEEAMVRLKLTEADLVQRQKEFQRLVIILTIVGFGVLGYTFYLFWVGSLTGGIASLALTVLVFSYSFRYHFWLFQIRQRKLGCTLREWLDSGFMGGKK